MSTATHKQLLVVPAYVCVIVDNTGILNMVPYMSIEVHVCILYSEFRAIAQCCCAHCTLGHLHMYFGTRIINFHVRYAVYQYCGCHYKPSSMPCTYLYGLL